MSHQGVDLILAQWLNINAGCDQSGLAAQDVPLVQLGVLLLVSLAFAAACLATLRRVNVDR